MRHYLPSKNTEPDLLPCLGSAVRESLGPDKNV